MTDPGHARLLLAATTQATVRAWPTRASACCARATSSTRARELRALHAPRAWRSALQPRPAAAAAAPTPRASSHPGRVWQLWEQPAPPWLAAAQRYLPSPPGRHRRRRRLRHRWRGRGRRCCRQTQMPHCCSWSRQSQQAGSGRVACRQQPLCRSCAALPTPPPTRSARPVAWAARRQGLAPSAPPSAVSGGSLHVVCLGAALFRLL